MCFPDITLFVRIDTYSNYCYLNKQDNSSFRNEGFHFPQYHIPITNSTVDEKRSFDYVYRRKNT